MADTLIKSTTRHIRLFTARVEAGQLVADASQLTMDVDPDNEFLWEPPVLEKLQQRFRDLVASHAGAVLPLARLHRTPLAEWKLLATRLGSTRARVLGGVLNRF